MRVMEDLSVRRNWRDGKKRKRYIFELNLDSYWDATIAVIKYKNLRNTSVVEWQFDRLLRADDR